MYVCVFFFFFFFVFFFLGGGGLIKKNVIEHFDEENIQCLIEFFSIISWIKFMDPWKNYKLLQICINTVLLF